MDGISKAPRDKRGATARCPASPLEAGPARFWLEGDGNPRHLECRDTAFDSRRPDNRPIRTPLGCTSLVCGAARHAARAGFDSPAIHPAFQAQKAERRCEEPEVARSIRAKGTTAGTPRGCLPLQNGPLEQLEARPSLEREVVGSNPTRSACAMFTLTEVFSAGTCECMWSLSL